MTELKGEIENPLSYMWETLYTSFSERCMNQAEKVPSKDTDMDKMMNKLELIDICRTQFPTTSNIHFLQVQMEYLQKLTLCEAIKHISTSFKRLK